jgi:choline dehydrogenase-like flavoprotein
LIRDEFDYVVIGGGSAGCVVAGRLSEDPSIEVALVEAGPSDSNPAIHVPARFWEQQKSTLDWDFESEPEPGLNGRRTYLPRGRVLGGTGSMNTMLYVRGAAEDYDAWAAAGCKGWSFDDVLPLFRRSEDNRRGESRYHGTGGPLAVEDPPVPALLSHWVAAAEEAGHPANKDFNGEAQDGVGVYQSTQRDGRRCSSSTAFVGPNLGRPNLTVLTCTQALRLQWIGGRASGVEVDRFGEAELLRAAREVIVCAGAYLSPQLLMLSGIGPADQLREMEIEPLVDNPAVGENLQDHPGCFLNYPARIGAEEGDGWIEAGGFARTADVPLPDVQFHAAAGSFADEGVSSGRAPALSFGPYVTRPKSRGRVRLRSPLPLAKPRISHNFLADPDDVEVLRRGVRMAIAIAESPSLRDVLEDPAEAIAAGALPRSDSHAAIEQHIRATAFSFYHPAGTCAMGSVVDSELRVMGVEGVRVCDTSIMPNLTVGNTNAPAIMFGEKLAGMLRAERTKGHSEICRR